MHGQGTFFDPRLNDATRFPVAARAGFARRAQRPGPDHVEAAGAAVLPAVAPGADAAARQLRRARRHGPARTCSTAPARCASLSRAAALHRAGLEPAHRRRDRHRRLPGAADRRTSAIAPRRWRVSSRGRRAASTTTAASRPCGPWSTTTTGRSGSTSMRRPSGTWSNTSSRCRAVLPYVPDRSSEARRRPGAWPPRAPARGGADCRRRAGRRLP